MPPKIVPPDKNGAAEYMLLVFQKTEKKLIQEIERKRRLGYVDYAEVAALQRVRKTLQEMLDEAEAYVPKAIEYEFYEGYAAKKGYENALGLVNPQRSRAVEQLVDNLLGEVEEIAVTAYQSTTAQLFLLGSPNPDIYRQAGLEAAITSLAEGRGALTSVPQLIESVQKAGITAFVDKRGREWSLTDYGSMAVRTTVRQAQVSAVLTEDEHDLYKILAIGSTCKLCAAYEGRIYSKSGMNPNYPPLAAAFGKIDKAGPDDLSNTFLNIHPNCLHTLVKWTEKGKTEKQIQKARDFSSPEKRPFDLDYRTRKQREAYQEKERKRVVYRNNVKQFQKLAQAGVPGLPKTYQTFEKHKKLHDEQYYAWLKAFRERGKQ